MPLPEGYLPREGDVLILHGTVKFDVVPKDDVDEDGLKVFVNIAGDYQARRLSLTDVVGIYARKFTLGERVRLIRDPKSTGEVVGAHGVTIWVKADKSSVAFSGYATLYANDLELIPADPEVLAEPPPASVTAEPPPDEDEIQI